MQFVINELLEARKGWDCIPRFADFDAESAYQILEEAGRFAVQSVAPSNSPGDLQGCRFRDGAVTTPDGYIGAYLNFCEVGWPTLACGKEYGGQGLPQILNAALYEMLNATNHAWAMYPGLSHGAYECLRAHASEDIKSQYLPMIVNGKWLSTMCLTEPQAGSDVGLVRTRAVPQHDGTYAVTGSKVFISGGEHDLTDNILHLVLARLPNSPAGTRGISLFLVPKYLPHVAATRTNGVRCEGIERKMGIKGSATCVMTFESAQGFLIGEQNRGLAAMFVMMNSARLHVGMQGLGHTEMAYQNALRYANERPQMRAVTRHAPFLEADANGADPIILQPAIRKTLLTLRAFVEGERALGYWAAHLLDLAEFHPDPARRVQANAILALLTPVIKSFFTENGFALASAALQVWGGYGYVHDYGIEQTLRDSRIAMIYEGTNEVQAVDLVVRKVIGDRGRNFAVLMQWVSEEANLCANVDGCEGFGDTLRSIHHGLTLATADIITHSATDAESGHRIASDFLRLVGLLLLGCWWSRAARIATARASERFYQDKLATAHFYFDYVMPESSLRLQMITQFRRPLPWLRIPAGLAEPEVPSF